MAFFTKYCKKIREPRDGIKFTEPSMAQQHFKAECDINNIINGSVQQVVNGVPGQRQAVFGDFTEVPQTYQEYCNRVVEARENFMLLDSKIRRRFDNDPHKLIDFLADKGNLDEAVKLGIVNSPAPAPVTPEPAPAPVSPEGGSK